MTTEELRYLVHKLLYTDERVVGGIIEATTIPIRANTTVLLRIKNNSTSEENGIKLNFSIMCGKTKKYILMTCAVSKYARLTYKYDLMKHSETELQEIYEMFIGKIYSELKKDNYVIIEWGYNTYSKEVLKYALLAYENNLRPTIKYNTEQNGIYINLTNNKMRGYFLDFEEQHIKEAIQSKYVATYAIENMGNIIEGYIHSLVVV